MEIGTFLLMSTIPLLLALAINAALGVFSLGMARKRGLKPLPAFLAVLFGSFVALLLIAAIPESGAEGGQ